MASYCLPFIKQIQTKTAFYACLADAEVVKVLLDLLPLPALSLAVLTSLTHIVEQNPSCIKQDPNHATLLFSACITASHSASATIVLATVLAVFFV